MSSLNNLLNYTPESWTDEDYSATGCVLVELKKNRPKFKKLANLIRESLNVTVTKIVRVQNPYLYGQFLLKCDEYRMHNVSVDIKELFHDTAQKHVDSIACNNFDWRVVQRARYGLGVSFSPNCAYANQHSSRKNGKRRAMIIADVLVGDSCFITNYYERQKLPPNGCKTVISKNGHVFVKFYDDEFYPKYIIYYNN